MQPQTKPKPAAAQKPQRMTMMLISSELPTAIYNAHKISCKTLTCLLSVISNLKITATEQWLLVEAGKNEKWRPSISRTYTTTLPPHTASKSLQQSL